MYMRQNKGSRVRKRPFSSSIKGRATNASHAQSSYRRCLVHVTLRFGGGKLRSSFDSMITSSYLNLAPVVSSHTYICNCRISYYQFTLSIEHISSLYLVYATFVQYIKQAFNKYYSFCFYLTSFQLVYVFTYYAPYIFTNISWCPKPGLINLLN